MVFYLFLRFYVCWFLYGPFCHGALNLTYLHCLQHSFFNTPSIYKVRITMHIWWFLETLLKCMTSTASSLYCPSWRVKNMGIWFYLALVNKCNECNHKKFKHYLKCQFIWPGFTEHYIGNSFFRLKLLQLLLKRGKTIMILTILILVNKSNIIIISYKRLLSAH